MINDQLNNVRMAVVKLAELIAEEEESRYYMVSKYSLIRLNALVDAHAIVTGTKAIHYTQDKPEPAKDYA